MFNLRFNYFKYNVIILESQFNDEFLNTFFVKLVISLKIYHFSNFVIKNIKSVGLKLKAIIYIIIKNNVSYKNTLIIYKL